MLSVLSLIISVRESIFIVALHVKYEIEKTEIDIIHIKQVMNVQVKWITKVESNVARVA